MVCIRNNLKVHTQQLQLGSNSKLRESIKHQVHEPGPVFRSGFKTFKDEKELFEDDEFAITLQNEEMLNHDHCTWLSIGDALSPSLCSKDNNLFGHMDLKIDAWFISLLSTQSSKCDTVLDTKVTFFDGSRVNPIEEASLILYQRKILDQDVVSLENLEEEEVVSWLQNESSDNYQEESFAQTLNQKSKSKQIHFYVEYEFPNPVKYSVSSIADSDDEHSLFSSSSSSNYSSEIMDLEKSSIDTTDVAKSRNVVVKEQPEADILTKKYMGKQKVLLEDLLLVEKLNVEGVIEQVLGLGEFDGHEGIDSEFNKDNFSFI